MNRNIYYIALFKSMARLGIAGIMSAAFCFALGQKALADHVPITVSIKQAQESAASSLPLPSSQESFKYYPSSIAVTSSNASHSRPMGVGAVATGGDTLRLQIDLNRFVASVDIYGAYIASYDPGNVHVLNPDGISFSTFTLAQINIALSSGVFPTAPWKANISEHISERPLGDMLAKDLPLGKYNIYLLIVPAGRTDLWYLWESEFMISNFTLTVDKLGEGSVSGIDCDDVIGECSMSYKQGEKVNLVASETDADYKFHSWRGCDIVQNYVCTVEMNKDRTVSPAFTREVALVNTPKELSTQYLQDFKLDAADEENIKITFYFSTQATDILNLKSGDIITVNSDIFSGIRKVLSIPKSQNGQIVVETEDVPIEEIMQEGTTVYSEKLTHADLLSVTGMAKGISLRKAERLDSTEFTFEFDNVDYWSIARDSTEWEWPINPPPIDGLTLNGRVTFELESFFDLDVGLFSIKKLETGIIATNKNDLNMTVEGGAYFETKDILIGQKKFKPKPVCCAIAPVIWIRPVINVYVGADGHASAKLTTGLTLNNELKLGIGYKKAKGKGKVYPIGDFDQKKEYHKPSLSGEASVRGYIKPQCEIWINGVFAPYFYVKPYLENTIKTTSNQCDWEVWLDLYAGVGGKLKIFKKLILNEDIPIPIPGFPILLAHSKEDIPDDHEPPSVPIINRVESYYMEGIGVYWHESTDNIQVDGYKVYRDGIYIESVTSAEYFDDHKNVISGITYCYRITAYDLAGNESLKSAEKCETYSPDSAKCTSDADCDNGLFCDGTETCDITTGSCMAGPNPCPIGTICEEETKSCSDQESQIEKMIWDTQGGGDIRFSIERSYHDFFYNPLYKISVERYSFSPVDVVITLTNNEPDVFDLVNGIFEGLIDVNDYTFIPQGPAGTWTSITLIYTDSQEVKIDNIDTNGNLHILYTFVTDHLP